MIQTNFIKENDQIVAVILDYHEYQRLRMIEEDVKDYATAVHIKQTNTTWVKHNDLKQELGLS